MRKVDYMSVAQQVMDQIKKGAFLTVKADDQRHNALVVAIAAGCSR